MRPGHVVLRGQKMIGLTRKKFAVSSALEDGQVYRQIAFRFWRLLQPPCAVPVAKLYPCCVVLLDDDGQIAHTGELPLRVNDGYTDGRVAS